MDAVLAHDLQPHHFLQRRQGDESAEPLPGEVYAWQLQHARAFRDVPSLELLHARWPLFEMAHSVDGVAGLLDQMLREVNRRLIIDRIRELSALADDQSRLLDAPTIFYESAREFANAVPGTKVTRLSDALSMLDLYKIKEATGRTPGISFGMQWLDDLTYGMQAHEMVIIEAFLGQRKSSWAALICANAYFLHGRTPMFFSFEMEAHKLVERWIALAAGFQYTALKRLQLGEGDLRNWEEIGQRAADARFEKDVLVIDDERRPTDDFIYSRIEQYRPDFSVIDTLDEVRAPASIRGGMWEKQDHTAREVKGIARATRKPIIAIAQANREAEKDGANLGNIANSITIARKADIAVGMHATEAMKKMHYCEFTLLKNRDDGGEGTKKAMYFHPGTMELRPWLPTDNLPTKKDQSATHVVPPPPFSGTT